MDKIETKLKVAWKETKDGMGHPSTLYLCPKCYAGLFTWTDQCPYCGQRIDWSEGGEHVTKDYMRKAEYER